MKVILKTSFKKEKCFVVKEKLVRVFMSDDMAKFQHMLLFLENNVAF